MSQEENKAIVRRFYEGLSSGNFDAASAVLDRGLKATNLDPNQPLDYRAYRETAEGFLRAFPDSRLTVDQIVAEGDLVAVRGTCRGTQRAEFEGIPATGKSISITFFSLSRVANGKIVEIWALDDMFSLMQQLGVLPSEGQMEEQSSTRTTQLRH